MNAQVAIYYREGKIIVAPQGGGGGYYFDIDPIRIVSPTSESVQEAVMEALAVSNACSLLEPPVSGKYRSPVLAAVGVRSWKSFYKGASHCFLYSENDKLYLQIWIPASDGRGFVPGPASPIPIADTGVIADLIFKCMRIACQPA